jgi:nucleoid-associated protein YgaU
MSRAEKSSRPSDEAASRTKAERSTAELPLPEQRAGIEPATSEACRASSAGARKRVTAQRAREKHFAPE